MESTQWKYKIGSGIMPVILSGGMLVIFGGLALWLRSQENGAVLFGYLLSSAMAVVFLLSVYRAVFYKVLIGRDGFFYQTNPVNGCYYDYGDIAEAWKSSGEEPSGDKSRYCVMETPDKGHIRFPFYPRDVQAVSYLLRRVKAKGGNTAAIKTYRIDGRTRGKAAMGVILVILGILAALEAGTPGSHFVPGILMAAVALVVLVSRYVAFLVQIGPEGFFFRTNPWNGRFYTYEQILDCREERRVIRRGGFGNRRYTYHFFFHFTEASGEKRRFQFEKPLFNREVQVLQDRIREAGKQKNSL